MQAFARPNRLWVSSPPLSDTAAAAAAAVSGGESPPSAAAGSVGLSLDDASLELALPSTGSGVTEAGGGGGGAGAASPSEEASAAAAALVDEVSGISCARCVRIPAKRRGFVGRSERTTRSAPT